MSEYRKLMRRGSYATHNVHPATEAKTMTPPIVQSAAAPPLMVWAWARTRGRARPDTMRKPVRK